MNQPMAIDELVSVAQAEAMGELDAPMMAIVLSSEQSYDLPINSPVSYTHLTLPTKRIV